MSETRNPIEVFRRLVDGCLVEITNTGTKKFEDQSKEANQDMEAWIAEGIRKDKTGDWTPYNNFESEVSWKLIDES